MLKQRLRPLLHVPFFGNIWRILKLCRKFIRKCMTGVKAVLFYCRWYFCEREKMYGKMQNVKNLKPFRPLRWKNGVCYFTGEMKGSSNEIRKVFIKTGGIVNTVSREVNALTCAAERSSFLREHIPSVINYSESVLIEDYILGKKLHPGKNFVEQLYMFYRELKRCNILHLDLRPDNFMVTEDGLLVLIDFGYALIDSSDIYDHIDRTAEAKRIIKKVGSKYAPKNGTADDAYSMLMTMKYIWPSLMRDFPQIWRELNEDIGERAVRIL